jgi:hypothetical protein
MHMRSQHGHPRRTPADVTLDFLVRSPGAPKGAGQRLTTSLQADWPTANAIVVGYPANQGLIASTSSWVRAATIPEAAATGNAAWPSTPRRQRKGPLHDDHPTLSLPKGSVSITGSRSRSLCRRSWAVFHERRRPRGPLPPGGDRGSLGHYDAVLRRTGVPDN